jgi:ABC-2 family transporter
MRWHIVRTLFWKEVQRQLANRGSLALAALLVVASLLLTLFNRGGGPGGALSGGVEYCFIDYWRDDDWVRHLHRSVPPEFEGRIKFRDVNQIAGPDTLLTYPPGSGAIQMRIVRADDGRQHTKVCIWQASAGSLAAYEAWFWRESARYFQQQAAASHEGNQLVAVLAKLHNAVGLPDARGPDAFEQETARLEGGVDMRSSITGALVLFALFFSCVYLLPSMMCEERERGILLAQALSPASPVEILAAKFLFYPMVGIALAATLAGIARPEVLLLPFFWLVLTVAAFGSLGIGLTIASIARSQRTASMGALCYMLVVALFLFICQQGNIPVVSHIALEYHCPRMLHASLTYTVQWWHWFNLAAAAALAAGWAILATALFRRYGWQT